MSIVIIGAGAAGLMAAANINAPVTVLERNEKAGKKLYITGKGRCNLSNIDSPAVFLKSVVCGEKFARSSIYRFPSQFVINFFEQNGLPLKTERGGRVFPQSDKASDVTKTLVNKIINNGGKILYNSFVTDIKVLTDGYELWLQDGKKLEAKTLVIATGGKSYPHTGSDGSAYSLLQNIGHNITALYPSLVAINLSEDVSSLKGISFKNVDCKLSHNEGSHNTEGEILFTDKGISGPIVLTLSAFAAGKNNLSINIDFYPSRSQEEIDNKLIRLFSAQSASAIKNVLCKILPKSLALYILKHLSIDIYKKPAEITKAERTLILNSIKNIKFSIASLGGFEQAVVTRGGVDLSQISPKTMESKLYKNLYIIGEVLNVDALTGGYNLQLAWSQGLSAAESINKSQS